MHTIGLEDMWRSVWRYFLTGLPGSLSPLSDGSYDELLTDDAVDIVYVGNIHSFRRTIGEKCLKANKHVLLEKPFACSAEDAQHLIDLAKERNLFLMEVSDRTASKRISTIKSI
jgi:predicted dehydrogenase